MKIMEKDWFSFLPLVEVKIMLWTGNTSVKGNGEAILGRGLAKQIKEKWGVVPKRTGATLETLEFLGSFPVKMPGKPAGAPQRVYKPAVIRVGSIGKEGHPARKELYMFPVKLGWWQKADLELIKAMATQLKELCKATDGYVVMNFPAIGNGGLDYNVVLSALKPILGGVKNLILVTNPPKKGDSTKKDLGKPAPKKRFITITGTGKPTSEEFKILRTIAEYFDRHGFIVRSGGSPGSDQAVKYCLNKEIYIPWEGYNKTLAYGKRYTVSELTPKVKELVSKVYQGTHMQAHSPSVYQLLGYGLDQPSEAVFYIASENKDRVLGTTATAVYLAKELGIQSYNIRNLSIEDLRQAIKEVKK